VTFWREYLTFLLGVPLLNSGLLAVHGAGSDFP